MEIRSGMAMTDGQAANFGAACRGQGHALVQGRDRLPPELSGPKPETALLLLSRSSRHMPTGRSLALTPAAVSAERMSGVIVIAIGTGRVLNGRYR